MKQNFHLDQGTFNLRFSSAGICAILSARWISMMMREKGEGSGHRKAELEAVLNGGGPVAQWAYSNHWDSAEDVVTNNSGCLRMGGNLISAGSRQWAGYPGGTTLVNYIKDERKTGFHFNFGFFLRSTDTTYSGHAIAFWRSGHSGVFASGHMYFYDPNEGEFKGDKGEFGSWLNGYMTRTYQMHGAIGWSYILKTGEPKAVKLGTKVM